MKKREISKTIHHEIYQKKEEKPKKELSKAKQFYKRLAEGFIKKQKENKQNPTKVNEFSVPGMFSLDLQGYRKEQLQNLQKQIDRQIGNFDMTIENAKHKAFQDFQRQEQGKKTQDPKKQILENKIFNLENELEAVKFKLEGTIQQKQQYEEQVENLQTRLKNSENYFMAQQTENQYQKDTLIYPINKALNTLEKSLSMKNDTQSQIIDTIDKVQQNQIKLKEKQEKRDKNIQNIPNILITQQNIFDSIQTPIKQIGLFDRTPIIKSKSSLLNKETNNNNKNKNMQFSSMNSIEEKGSKYTNYSNSINKTIIQNSEDYSIGQQSSSFSPKKSQHISHLQSQLMSKIPYRLLEQCVVRMDNQVNINYKVKVLDKFINSFTVQLREQVAKLEKQLEFQYQKKHTISQQADDNEEQQYFKQFQDLWIQNVHEIQNTFDNEAIQKQQFNSHQFQKKLAEMEGFFNKNGKFIDYVNESIKQKQIIQEQNIQGQTYLEELDYLNNNLKNLYTNMQKNKTNIKHEPSPSKQQQQPIQPQQHMSRKLKYFSVQKQRQNENSNNYNLKHSNKRNISPNLKNIYLENTQNQNKNYKNLTKLRCLSDCEEYRNKDNNSIKINSNINNNNIPTEFKLSNSKCN